MRERLESVWAYVCTIDPGTMRSLIWGFCGVMGMDRGETTLTYMAGIATVALSVVSAAMPKKP